MGLISALVLSVAVSYAYSLGLLVLESLCFSLRLNCSSLFCCLGCLPVRIISFGIISVGINNLCGSNGSGLYYSLGGCGLVAAIECYESRRNSRLILLVCSILVIRIKCILHLGCASCRLSLSSGVINHRSGCLGSNIRICYIAVYYSNCGRSFCISLLCSLFCRLVILSLLLFCSRYCKECVALCLLLSLGILLIRLLLRSVIIGLGRELLLRLRRLFCYYRSRSCGSEVGLCIAVYYSNCRRSLGISLLCSLLSNLILLSLLLFCSRYCKECLTLRLLLSLSVLLIGLLLRCGIVGAGRNYSYCLGSLGSFGSCLYGSIISLSIGINGFCNRCLVVIYLFSLLRAVYDSICFKLGILRSLFVTVVVSNGGYFIVIFLARRAGKYYGSLGFIIVRAIIIGSTVSLDHNHGCYALGIALCLSELLDSLLFGSICLEKSCRLLNAGIYPLVSNYRCAFPSRLVRLIGCVILLVCIGIFNISLGNTALSCLDSSMSLKKSLCLLNAGIYPFSFGCALCSRLFRCSVITVLCIKGAFSSCLLFGIELKKVRCLRNARILIPCGLGSCLSLIRGSVLGYINRRIICVIFYKRGGRTVSLFLAGLVMLRHNCVFLVIGRNVSIRRRVYEIIIISFTAKRNDRWHSSTGK